MQWVKGLAPLVAFMVVGALVYKGIVNQAALLGMLMWFAPSPQSAISQAADK